MLIRCSAYSMFWICSRTWSISTFSSTAACEVRASTDLEPSVLASRLNSCSRKSRRRPTGFASAPARGGSRRCGCRGGRVPRRRRASAATAPVPARAGPGRAGCARSARRASSFCRWPARITGISVRTSRGDAGDAVDALGDHRGQLGALALARGDEFVQHLVEQRQRLGLQRGRIGRRRLQHAGELQQLGELDPHRREARRHVAAPARASCRRSARVRAAGRRRLPARAGAGPGRACRARCARRRARAAPAPARAVRRAGACRAPGSGG